MKRPSEPARPSGRFLLRIDPDLHAALKESAQRAGLSLNEYCARRLALLGGRTLGPGAQVVERAAAVVGADPLGVVLFGSWARGELAAGSDVDLLVVVDPSTPVTRALYQAWDREPLEWEGRPVEPHFVHLPSGRARISGMWAEVAVDGVVLYDPEFAISRHLVGIRRAIAEGGIARRRAHGQPYWVGGTHAS